MELAKSAGAKRAIALNVSGAFHSPLMAVAEEGLRAQLDGVRFGVPGFPVVSNVTGQPVAQSAEAKRLLVKQLTSPVRWTACVRAMLEGGVSRFIELGPGNVLAGLLRRIERGAEVITVGKADEAQAVLGS
jgi:[acyl-carrier-protein] S-malonyltransferase